MSGRVNLKDLLQITHACNEFEGDIAALARLIRSGLEPLQCLHAGMFCLVTRRGVVDWFSPNTGEGPAALRHDHDNWYAGRDSAATLGGSRAMNPYFDAVVRQEARMCGAHIAITSKKSNFARMRESRFTFLAASGPCDRSEAECLIRLVAPQLHFALSRVRCEGVVARFSLTKAERQVAIGLLRGWTNKEIAKVFGKSDATIRNQLHYLFNKLQVRRRSTAVEILRRSYPDEMAYAAEIELRDADADAAVRESDAIPLAQ